MLGYLYSQVTITCGNHSSFADQGLSRGPGSNTGPRGVPQFGLAELAQRDAVIHALTSCGVKEAGGSEGSREGGGYDTGRKMTCSLPKAAAM